MILPPRRWCICTYAAYYLFIYHRHLTKGLYILLSNDVLLFVCTPMLTNRILYAFVLRTLQFENDVRGIFIHEIILVRCLYLTLKRQNEKPRIVLICWFFIFHLFILSP
jgi:hypothetical protein